MQNSTWPVREFPPISITIREDLTGELLIGAAKTLVAGESEMDVRRQLVTLVIEHARTSGYGVAVTASDGEVLERFEVYPNGEIKELSSDPITPLYPANASELSVDDESWAVATPPGEISTEPDSAGTDLFGDPGQGEAPATGTSRPRKGKTVLVLATAGIAVLACAVAGVATITQAVAPPREVSGTGALWSIPDDVSAVAAAGDLVAGTSKGALVLFEGTTGKPVPVQGKVAVPDATKVRAASGDGISVIAVTETSGVVVAGGTARAYEGKGALLDRGPVPVLVGGTAEDRTFWVFRDGVPVRVQPPEAGNSIFGGLAGGGSVWAATGGKVTYVPATGEPRTVTLVPPAPGATVSGWLSVNETTVVVLWKAGDSRVLAEHTTAADGKGSITAKTALAEGDTVTPVSGTTLLRQGGVSVAFPVGADDPRCADPVLTSKALWCPGPDDIWSSAAALVHGEPTAAGAGFALVVQDGQTLAVPAKPTE